MQGNEILHSGGEFGAADKSEYFTVSGLEPEVKSKPGPEMQLTRLLQRIRIQRRRRREAEEEKETGTEG